MNYQFYVFNYKNLGWRFQILLYLLFISHLFHWCWFISVILFQIIRLFFFSPLLSFSCHLDKGETLAYSLFLFWGKKWPMVKALSLASSERFNLGCIICFLWPTFLLNQSLSIKLLLIPLLPLSFNVLPFLLIIGFLPIFPDNHAHR